MRPSVLPPLWSLPLALALLAPLGFCRPAAADVFEAITLASADSRQQADHADDPAISADGRYIAFDGSVAGRSGVFRRDLLTHEIETVAEDDGRSPSISADGRYVSFTTTAQLDEEYDTNAAPDVYVRDMRNPNSEPCRRERDESSEPCAFTLVSAVDRSRRGLSYEYGANPSIEEHRYGSVAAGRSALSADGRRVAFVTTAASNLSGPGTPQLQVAVRELDAQSTELVSVRSGTAEPVPVSAEGGYGAVYPGGSQRPVFPNISPIGASISADGSTVVWMGQEIEQQAPVLALEPHMEPKYAEPLWRRIAAGPGAPIRRVTGGGDPVSGTCAASGELGLTSPPTLSDPCQGPLDTAVVNEGGIWGLAPVAADLPKLSADGRIVAFASNAPQVGVGGFGNTFDFTDDLYIADMSDGLTRVQAFRRLTEVAGGNSAETERVAPIGDLGVSPDGSEIAFSTQRTIFPLGSPTYVNAPRGVAAAQELFDVNLANDTLTRVTQSYEGAQGEPTSALTGSPSFSGDGDALAFSSGANNLVYGDGNGASDAFVVRRKRFPAQAVSQYISAAPANPTTRVDWLLGLSASSRRDGSVLLEAQVPGAGTLRAGAQGSVRAKRCKRGRRGPCRRGGTTVATRTVASRVLHSRAPGLALTVLRLSTRYGSLAKRHGGLSARATVTFTAPGHPKLQGRIAVTFRRALKARGHAHRAHAGAHRRVGWLP
jgi:Tol biopolymer transport system component